PLTQGHRIEQRLGGMLVHTVPGVDDRRAVTAGRDPPGHLDRGAGGGMSHDERVRADSREGERGVAERLTLLHRGCAGRDVDDVGAHPFARGLERHPGPGRVLVEDGEDGPAPQRREFADLTAEERLLEAVSLVEYRGRGVEVEVGGGEQMLHEVPSPADRWRSTPSVPSVSSSRTETSSSREVGTFLPT